MNVGRSHIAATVNTLVLAYVGASLPLIVLFAAGRQDPLLVVSGEVVAVEVVRAARREHRDRGGRADHDGHRGRADRPADPVHRGGDRHPARARLGLTRALSNALRR